MPKVLSEALEDGLFTRWQGPAPRSVWRSLVYLAAIAAGVLWLFRAVLVAELPLGLDPHAWISLNEALNEVVCGRPSTVSRWYDVAQHLYEHPEATGVPLGDLVVRLGGSVDAYCRTVTQSFLNNENSLMLVMRTALRVRPTLSLHELGLVLLGVKLAALLAFCFALLDSGMSLLFVTAMLVSALGILKNLLRLPVLLRPAPAQRRRL